ncbi:hypothetical protein H8959_007060, partial [Pygathrix nigripes]
QPLPPGCHGNDQAAGPLKTEKNSKCKTTHSTLACRLNQLSSQGEGSVARQRSVEWRGKASRWNSEMSLNFLGDQELCVWRVKLEMSTRHSERAIRYNVGRVNMMQSGGRDIAQFTISI